MTMISNASLTTLAAQQWQAADNKKGKGDAFAMMGLAQVFASPLSVKDGDVTVTKTLANWCVPARNADGSVNTKLQGAIRDAAIREFFGVGLDGGDIPHAVKAGFSRVVRAAAFIHFAKAGFTLNAKRGVIENVPLALASVERLRDDKDALTKAGKAASEGLATVIKAGNPKMTADDALAAAADQIDGWPVTCDGADSRLFGKVRTSSQLAKVLSDEAVARGFVKAPDKRKGKTATADAGVGFVESLTFTRTTVAAWLDVDGETDIAPTAAMVAEMRALRDTLDAYLSSEAPDLLEPSH